MVSILVAVYNAEPWLSRCLDSLLGQTYASIEVICVDDASTDASLAIAQQYAQRDVRLRVIHLAENGGQAHARNVALAQSHGDYVCMLDADDWYSPDAIGLAVEQFEQHEQCDVVLFQLEKERESGGETYKMPSFECLQGEEAFRLSLDWQIHGIYMVRGELHRRVPYDETCRLYSDDNTTRMHFLMAREVRQCKGQYHYLQHQASMTHRVSVRRYDYLRANQSMRRQMKEAGVRPELMDSYERNRWLNLVDVMMFHHVCSRKLNPEERQYGLDELSCAWQSIDKKVLPHSLTRKLGYCPMPCFALFRAEEWIYFTLRGLLGKNKFID